jgi:hypothetical protein
MTKSWPTPCVLIEATLEYKKREKDKLNQPGFNFVATPQPKLRIVNITASVGAEDFAGQLHPKMRVPKRSIIHRAFTEDLMSPENAQENLNWWETSTDGNLTGWQYAVHAQKQCDKVQALLIPHRTN